MNSSTITGDAIPDATAQRLYFVSLMNMPSVTLAAQFRFTLGLQNPDIAAALKEITEFKTRYDENTMAYNVTVGADGLGFTSSLGGDFQDRQAAIVSDTLARMESSLSKAAFARLMSGIKSAKEKMKIGRVSANNSMGCCYNSVLTDTYNIISMSPFHATWTHEETIEGSASGIYPGVTHYASINLSANGHTFSGSSARVAPATYLQYSGSITLDSNDDSCLLQGNSCATADTGNVICSASGEIFVLSFWELIEMAWSQSVWPGTPPVSPTGCSEPGPNWGSACYYNLQMNCSAATTPPDFWVSYIQSGTNFTGAAPAYWTSVTFCAAPAFLGNRTGPYKCAPVAGSLPPQGGYTQPPYNCTAKNTQGIN